MTQVQLYDPYGRNFVTSRLQRTVERQNSQITLIANELYDVIGRVLDNNGNPIVGVIVQIDGKIAVTGEDGIWELNELGEGEYTVIASKEGYVFVPQDVVIEGDNPIIQIDDIQQVADTSCKLYAVHDEGLNNSQILVINMDEELQISPLGDKHKGADLEALALNNGKLLASSGNDTNKDNPSGHLYRVNLTTGQLTSKGDICFINTQGAEICGVEVSALTTHPDSTLWAWAENNGPLTVNPETGEGTLVLESDFPIEDITFNSSGKMLYGIANRELWRYDGTNAEVICTLPRQVEALESLPDEVRASYHLPEGHDVLIYSFHKSHDFMIRAIDASTCENIDEISIHTPDYNDIEGLVWVCE